MRDTVMVVGAGMAGIACARRLVEAGLKVLVVDKGRRVGGRMATREHGDVFFDHGAQFFTARSRDFSALAATWSSAGVTCRLEDRAVSAASGDGAHTQPPRDSRLDSASSGEPRWRGARGMNDVARFFAAGLDTMSHIHIEPLVDEVIRSRDGSTFPLPDALVVAVPAPQAAALVPSVEGLGEALAPVEIAPCWALLVDVAAARKPGAYREPTERIAWASDAGGGWTFHATLVTSQALLECSPDEVVAALLPEALAWLGAHDVPRLVHAHRWRYARTVRPLGRPFWEGRFRGRPLLLLGDWCIGARIEDAFESGRCGAARLLESF